MESSYANESIFNMTQNCSNLNKKDDTGWFLIYYLPNIIFYGVASLLGTPGNMLVIWITGFRMKTINAKWILHLAIADLICCVFIFVRCAYFIALYHYYYNIYSSSDQRLYFSVSSRIGVYLSIYASVLFLTVMSVDRCVSLMCTYWYKTHRTSKHVHITAAIVWVMSSTLTGFHAYNIILHSNSNHTVEYILIVVLTTCFAIIITCYFLICFKLKKIKRPNRSQRPYRVITALIICLFICWGPYYIHQIIYNYLWRKTYIIMKAVSYGLACFNSCINPIIYVFIGQDFKETLMASLPPGVKTVINKCCNQTSRKPESYNEEIPNTDV